MPFAAALLFTALFAVGDTIDRSHSLSQSLLFGSNYLASLGGAGLAAAWLLPRSTSVGRGLAAALAILIGWRVAYFPIMVFSGHVASIGEWAQQSIGMTAWVYPVFLVSAAALHAVVALLAGTALLRAAWIPRLAAAGGLVVAALVSFTQLADLTPQPDAVWELEASAATPATTPLAEEANPYLPAVSAAGYGLNQRVMLIAAGATYETIPNAPWARGVRSALEVSFRDNPFGSTHDRIREHYMAYHSAHALIGQ